MEHLECKNVNKQKTMVLKVVGKKAVWIFFRLKKKRKIAYLSLESLKVSKYEG